MPLSPSQSEVVNHADGPLLVVAGPGSGKTRVLTERVRRLLTGAPGHFRVLALTFTNKAAREMEDRLSDLGDVRRRAYIGTLHAFCMEMLGDRGKPVGVLGVPSIFERREDRRAVLLEAVRSDPELLFELEKAGDPKAQSSRIDDWLRGISVRKAHPLTGGGVEDPLLDRLVELYDAGLRASGAYDYEDLLCLARRLLTEHPATAGFYRRLYGYVCIDEAQDLNEAQYALLLALCGSEFRNVLMVGDPKQSIFGFNTSSPAFMDAFERDFGARRIELAENFRSSRAVVQAARALEPTYSVSGVLPIAGEVRLLVGSSEEHEAARMADKMQALLRDGHPDVEGPITPGRCAVLGRTRYTLLAIEKELDARKVPTYRMLSAGHETESDIMADVMLGLRVHVNPNDRLHLAELEARWRGTPNRRSPRPTFASVEEAALGISTARSAAVASFVVNLRRSESSVSLKRALQPIQAYADTLPDEERRLVHDDIEVFLGEWDRYLRGSNSGNRTVGGFMSHLALGTTRQPDTSGCGLLTVHSAKGLEFDVVFIVGMADNVFPDYRARSNARALEEERRNAFVAITRARRLAYLSYPTTRRMPWGDIWQGKPSPFLNQMGLLGP